MTNRKRLLVFVVVLFANVALTVVLVFCALSRLPPPDEVTPAPPKDDLPPRNLWDGLDQPPERSIPKK